MAVRSTNTGISAAILASGAVLDTSPTYRDWAHVYEIPYAKVPRSTVFMTWGYWLVPVGLALGLILVALRYGGRSRAELGRGGYQPVG